MCVPLSGFSDDESFHQSAGLNVDPVAAKSALTCGEAASVIISPGYCSLGLRT